ncbi:MAG: hypothetical protein AB8C84_10255 [Oligoflexales bacterium]
MEKISPILFALSLNSYAFSFTLLSELGVQSLNSTTDLIVFAARVAIDSMAVTRLFALGMLVIFSMSCLYAAIKFEWEISSFWQWFQSKFLWKFVIGLLALLSFFCVIFSEIISFSDWCYGLCFWVVYSPIFIWCVRVFTSEKQSVIKTQWIVTLVISSFIGSAYLGSYAAPQFIVFPGVMHQETAKLFLWDDTGGTSYVDCNEEAQRVEVWKGSKNEPLYYYYVANSDILDSVCERSFQ